MKRIDHRKKSVGKILTGILIGGVVGATVGWLTAPASGVEMRRRLAEAGNDGIRSVREKVKTAEGNVESRAREFMEKIDEKTGEEKTTTARRRRVISTY
ncbi:MAG TPA: YtxH domain-containing protein [Anaerolineales bacterium]|nr:YtxH domain-containing protein [Anaerolineales bacterium]